MFKILIADNEVKIRTTLCDYMNAKGLNAVPAKDGEEAVLLAAENNFDLIILDVMMPVLDGLGACREIRKYTDAPVLFLSALGEECDLLKGFESGCDDYIVKPFPLAVLYEKSLAMIKRSKGIDKSNRIVLGGVSLDLFSKKAYSDEEEISLSNRDFELLSYLVQNKGIVIARELILTKIWGYDYDGGTRVVDTHIKIIRKALGDNAKIIKTVTGVGYIAEV